MNSGEQSEIAVSQSEEIQSRLRGLQAGDEITVEAEGTVDDEQVLYRDNREVDFVDENGNIQFGDPATNGRVIDPERLTIYELGTAEMPLVDGLDITKLWVWGDA